MKVSIIIPTYNEEEYLPTLLKSIKSQKFDDYEVIIADANSTDRTIKIAKKYNCKIIKGGMPGIGRNKGAEIAKGEILLFLDSDLKLSNNYLKKVVDEFESKNVDIGITLMNPLSKSKRDKILHDIANTFMIIFEKIKPHGAGCYGIITKKEIHDKHNGFDKNLSFGEDTDYIERIAKNHNFKVLRSSKIGVSTRRLEKEGLKKLLKQYSKSTFNDLRGIRTHADELEYFFGHEGDPIEENEIIKKIEILKSQKAILSIDEKNNAQLIMGTKENKKENKESKKETKTKPIFPGNNLPVKSQKAIISDKKRIFYAVCGEGMGHAIRSAVIIEHLLKKYNIWIFASDRAYKYLKVKFDNVFEIGGFNTVYENNKVKNTKTFLNAVKVAPNNLKEGYETLYKKAKKYHPNIIITDFENYSNILSKILNIPLLSVDNIHMITKTMIDYPPEAQREMLKAKGVIKSYLIKPKKYILTSFFHPKVKNPEKAVIYPPVIREKIRSLETSVKDYIFVYQTSPSNEKLIKSLKKLNRKFIIYGYNQDKFDGNLRFRKFNEDKIYDDMKDSKAVIANGGFTFISEAIYLKKPIYSIPAKGNFEQLLNGYYVEKLGYGIMTRDFDIKTAENFFNNLDQYKKELSKVKNHDNSKLLKEIEDSIEKYAYEHLMDKNEF
ncbi:MJ1255/VC2487 family glycosyltransferase [Methanobrevibacter curvatus]|uniref:Putative glycosyltransferase EpsH n=1 Tax=Methanobrevibacter curvatus TaxID=49547 RepID=A0A166CN25_9EURY|nr:MJ1255/VC2487 family glycosyltransferase [Methanobrevibacter curvatus]KZX15567.1 putative glycosyltransferase EpsH [Methanobrevibacter curvatus]